MTSGGDTEAPAPTSTGAAKWSLRRRVSVFAVLVVSCVAFAGGYATYAEARQPSGVVEPTEGGPASPRVDLLLAEPHVLFRGTALDQGNGRLRVAPLDAPDTVSAVTDLRCERVHMAAGRGLCLQADRGVLTTYRAVIFGPDLEPIGELPLDGAPSRARVSPDGRYGATTVFVSGHSYAASGFSTATTLIDLSRGTEIANLEEFTTYRDGRRVHAPDFNFWGVTFTRDGKRFYATLATGGKTHLVEGDIAARTVRILRENVECPSLSPDGSRVAFKKRIAGDGPAMWRLHVLDLDTMQETPLAETRNVDDQVEWLDDGRVLYSLPDDAAAPITNTWVAEADGSGDPRMFVREAASTTVVRP